ncbi:hypothetical protein AUJ17_02915 [Candidatus Micrarchaeota archaeon CG1_02_47_40]|nr:MAG: hypothetical protein AUJ17_02915 [Candidatus Micrarchaeota archaeon CG1_02_47_40]
MNEHKTITLDMIYRELKSIRKELDIVGHAVIPVEKLSEKELSEHRRDLEEMQKGEKTDFRALSR